MLERILDKMRAKGTSHTYLMYDIAYSVIFRYFVVTSPCNYTSAIPQSHHRSDILNSVHLCLPTFHSYGHKVSCQVTICSYYTYGPVLNVMFINRYCLALGDVRDWV